MIELWQASVALAAFSFFGWFNFHQIHLHDYFDVIRKFKADGLSYSHPRFFLFGADLGYLFSGVFFTIEILSELLLQTRYGVLTSIIPSWYYFIIGLAIFIFGITLNVHIRNEIYRYYTPNR